MTGEEEIKLSLVGHNVLRLNKGSVIVALEYWLNNVVFQTPVTVTNVRELNTDNVFEISLKENEEE